MCGGESALVACRFGCSLFVPCDTGNYANFLKAALAEPSIVGVHWFQYLDQPVTGRLLDGENGHLGLVGITDVPYQGFIDAVRKANGQVVDVMGKTR